MEALLLQLKDIQAPYPPTWWPMAPGWWLLLFLTCATVTVWLVVKQKRKQANFRLAARQLDLLTEDYRQNGNQQALLLGISQWLRQVALMAYPEQQIAGLTGKSWLRFLELSLSTRDFSEGPGYIFAGNVYASNTDFEIEPVFDLCHRWLLSLKQALAKTC